ncbi:unannotated protein [freshwater metagenome]|uniref:Unannotated protein n=1 Tax=freshwater metagenome TaxID=449393 RepID=A0A6J7Q1V7_9ZZZZ
MSDAVSGYPPASFDEGYYLVQVGGSVGDAITPWDHYVTVGAAAGLDPAPWFQTIGYLDLHTDVAAAKANPFVHWLVYGQYEGRRLDDGPSGSPRLVETPAGLLPAGSDVDLVGPATVVSRDGSDPRVWNPSTRAWDRGGRREGRSLPPEAVVTFRDAQVTPDAGVSVGDWRMKNQALAGSGDIVEARYHGVGSWPLEPLPVVDEVGEAVLLGQPGDQVFGHQLLDVLPRLLTARRAGLGNLPLLVRRGAVSSMRRLFEACGLMDSELVELPAHGVVRARTLHVVTFARHHGDFDPARVGEVRALLQKRLVPSRSGSLLWMSRAQLGGESGARRRLVNRAEVDATAAAAGLEVIAPECRPLVEVLSRLVPGGLVAGEDGSALHNSIVMPAGSEVLVLRQRGHGGQLHSQLARALGQTSYEVEGREVSVPGQEEWSPRRRDWILEPEVLADLPRILGETQTASAATNLGR